MAQVDGNNYNTADSRSDELPPSFDPRCAFAWTLRSAEIARRKREQAHRQPNGSPRRPTPLPAVMPHQVCEIAA